MRRLTLLMLFISITQTTLCQLVINEVDADTPGVDKAEIIELKSEIPNFSTDEYVVVLFNGSSSGNDASYYTISLKGLTTDANSILLIGSSQLSPSPDIALDDNLLQNGADAIAIYQASFEDFPIGTKATKTNLVDALVYDTNDSDDVELMELLGETEQIDENENKNKDNESIQLKADGTYEMKLPTPGMPNDGSGIEFTTISFTTESTSFTEGEFIDIHFKTDRNLTEDLNFEIELENESFTIEDYSGNLQLTIPAGSDSTDASISLVDDSNDEGDELAIIRFKTLPVHFKRENDFIKIRIVDNDFQKMNWGSPLRPTYDGVVSTGPESYYEPLLGKSNEDLKSSIQQIIADPKTVRSHTYDDVIQILMEADQNPENSNQVWLLYSESSRSKSDFQWTNEQIGKWNREHVYPRSRGGYFSIKEDNNIDGIEIYTTTSIDSIRHGNSDAHGIRAVDSRENGRRGNKNYGEYLGPIETKGSWKGDVARSIFYMTLRYKGIGVEEGFPEANKDGRIGDLKILLDWHRNDPPDDFEMNRNNKIYKWQKNRNPFIDHPDLVEYIWGKYRGEVWGNTLSTDEYLLEGISVYPNPASDYITVSLTGKKGFVEIFDITGALRITSEILDSKQIPLVLPKGMYIVHISVENKKRIQKLFIE